MVAGPRLFIQNAFGQINDTFSMEIEDGKGTIERSYNTVSKVP